ncbi:MAG: hypothetical protein JNM34_11025 [Chthonomonadaceae bacterium]|nr:hypothetical protein [Chthonomonadaceae bacterium]
MRLYLSLIFAGPCLACAQFFTSFDDYPQFRAHSGMPGCGYGVDSNGKLGPKGAWAIATPIAYSPDRWQVSLGMGSVSRNLRPQFLDTAGASQSTSNGTMVATVGLPIGRLGRASFSYMALSSRFDNATNLTWTPPNQRGPVTLGVGVQALGGRDGTPFVGAVERYPRSARSWFAVATWEGPSGTYASLGKGTRRFQDWFGNVSTNLGKNAKLIAEYDGFNINCGIGYDFGDMDRSPIKGNKAGVSMFLGLVRGNHLNWNLAVRF